MMELKIEEIQNCQKIAKSHKKNLTHEDRQCQREVEPLALDFVGSVLAKFLRVDL